MSAADNKALVRRFYDELWNAHDLGVMPEILHEDFSFRGSLGQEKRGHQGFAEYVDMVHGALGQYRCDIDTLIAEGDHVFAKMQFHGIHRGEFMGYSPSGKPVAWAGSAVFTVDDGRMRDVWVLGDLQGLTQQLQDNAGGPKDTGSPIIPCLRYHDAHAAIDWLCRAFGFSRHLVVADDHGGIAHAQLSYGNGMIILGSVRDGVFDTWQSPLEHPESPVTQSPYMVVHDVDEHCRIARREGATVVMEPEDQGYGGRLYSCRDPEGHLWNFGSYDPWRD